MITACLFEEPARKAGLDFVPLGTKEEFESLQHDARIWKPFQATQLVFDYAGRSAMRTFEAIAKLSVEERPCLLLGSLLAFGGRLAREKLGIPLITVHLQPSVLISLHETPILFSEAPWISRLPRWIKKIIFSGPNPADQKAKPWLKKACGEIGVPPPRSVFRQWFHSPDGTLLLFPDWFAAPQPDWPAAHHQHTFPLEDLATEQSLSPELEQFLRAGEKPIIFTPGSANVQAHTFFRSALAAVEQTGRRAVFVSRDLSQLPPHLPSSVLAVSFLRFRGQQKLGNSTQTDMNNPTTLKRSYDEQFKRDAVALLEGGRKAAQLARDLGVSSWNLRDWKRRYGTGVAVVSQSQARSAALASAGGPGAVATAVEFAAVQRELATLRRQNDILKKALAIVAQQEADASNSSKPFTTSIRS
jgi:transposase-like protein